MEGDSKNAKLLQFEREKQAAANIEHNSEMLATKRQKVQAAGAFREMLPREQWQHSFKPRWDNEIKWARELKAWQVVSEDGKVAPLQTAQPVPQDTARRDAPDFRGRGFRDDRNRQNLRKFA